MAYYDPVIAVWPTTTLPAGVSGTALAAGDTAAQKLAKIDAWTVAGPAQTVSRGDVRQHFDNLVDASGVPVWEEIEAHKGDASAFGIACRAALRLRDAPGDYPPVDLTAALFKGQLAQLVTGGALTQAQADGVTALATPPLSWCAVNGYPYAGLTGLLSQGDVTAAGLV